MNRYRGMWLTAAFSAIVRGRGGEAGAGFLYEAGRRPHGAGGRRWKAAAPGVHIRQKETRR